MAILSDGDLSFELRYIRVEYGPVSWVYYRFRFLWQDIPIINDAILKRINDYWNDRREGELLACSDLDDDLLPVLERGLRENVPVEWEPVDPDVMISLFPDLRLAYWGTSTSLDVESDQKEEASEQSSPPNLEHDKDLFTLVVLVSPYQFKESDYYGCGGPGLQLVVSRSELEAFLAQLRDEFEALA